MLNWLYYSNYYYYKLEYNIVYFKKELIIAGIEF